MKTQKVLIAAVITICCSPAFAGPLNLLGVSGSHSGSNTTTLNINPLGAVTNLTSNLASRFSQGGQGSASGSASLGVAANLTANLAARLSGAAQSVSSVNADGAIDGSLSADGSVNSGDGASAGQGAGLLGGVFGLTSNLTSRLQQSMKLKLSHSGSSDVVMGNSSLHTFSDWSASGADGFTTTFGSSSSSSF